MKWAALRFSVKKRCPFPPSGLAHSLPIDAVNTREELRNAYEHWRHTQTQGESHT